ncbi:hypothetical protein TRSC58_05245 [Trypanosoma rangeli SC58]|uniref:Uncharacterized protein n=1 Tax=Trypanosoma rangeli SC58 TaxID=429131 RepID=A0A061J1E5_TRYRA|nr:hypothetical protein TRSC58_05245 [Trypanosoma rangeli SC58]
MPSSSLSLFQLREKAALFPVLTLYSCISDAQESGNGARYSAQDKFTGCMYEVRCLPLNVSSSQSDLDKLLAVQQKRLDALTSASSRGNVSASVSLPIDAYVQELASSKEYFVVSVSSFGGLSLGDMIRAGCRLLENADFNEILSCVEEYARESMRLPPHRNLTLNALLRQLTVRSGAVEMDHPSRWVIGDWQLLAEDAAPTTHEELVGDLEWLLYSAFEKLGVSCDPDGNVLRRDVVEMRINETIERIRKGTVTSVGRSPRASHSNTHVKKQIHQTRSVIVNGATTTTTAVGGDSGVNGGDSNELVDKVALHRQKLNEEQQFLRSFRSEEGKKGNSRDVLSRDGEELDDVEVPRRRVKVMDVFYPSKLLRSVTLETEASRKQFVGKKETILDAVTETLHIGLQRSRQNRQIEDDAIRMRREAILSMLMRSATLANKHANPSLVDTRNTSPSSQPPVQRASRLPNGTPLATQGFIPHSDDCMCSDTTTFRRSSSPVARRPDLPRSGIGPVLSSSNLERECISAAKHEMSDASEEQSITTFPMSAKGEAPSSSQKGTVGHQASRYTICRTDQHLLSPRRGVFNSVNTTERSPLGGTLSQGRTPRTTRRRQQTEKGNKHNIRSAPRRLVGNYSVPRLAVGNTVLGGTGFSHALLISHNKSEVLGASQSVWRGEDKHRSPCITTRGLGGVGSLSRGRVIHVNGPFLGMTARRRHADLGDNLT